ncbi:ATP-binding protein [Actinomadura parmotrematis]|uniref:ATP-binding protein n=1 Tax=Actinomadura parmotrematis TaxID=2864039 RepID=A0ABS7G1R0_9ACTN|nr:ATP-binding protein [Actinomadura parmotrematis]MBW8485588.1 ATP-binding protein [Actinomadura parmotrematis]
MIVDQAYVVTADRGRPHRHLDLPVHAQRTAEPAPDAGLRGLWPAPHQGAPRTARLVLRADRSAPASARDFARATLAGWDADGPADDVVTVVSELVTNALRHGLRDQQGAASGPIQLVLLAHPRRLVVTVSDPSARTPEPVSPAAEEFDEGGRGLLVIGALAAAWGFAPLGSGGKAVWASFDLA